MPGTVLKNFVLVHIYFLSFYLSFSCFTTEFHFIPLPALNLLCRKGWHEAQSYPLVSVTYF